MKHELHTYLYRCDGYRPDGRKCSEERRIEAFDWNDADVQISAASGIRTKPWKFTWRGWLCQRRHIGMSDGPEIRR